MYDSYQLDPLADLYRDLPIRRQRQSTARFQPLPPEAEESLIDQLLKGTTSSLSATANFLDTPRRFLWETLSGGTVSSGDDLLAAMGMPNDPNAWEFRDLGAFAAEVAGDPLSYLTLGGTTALGAAAKGSTKAAQALSKAGMADDALKALKPADGFVDALRQGQRSLVNVEIPFSGKQLASFGTGDKAADATKVAGDYLKGTSDLPGSEMVSSPFRFGRMLFDSSVKNVMKPIGQKLGETIYGNEPAAMFAARQAARTVNKQYNDVYKAFEDSYGQTIRNTDEEAVVEDIFDRIVRHTGETQGDLGDAFGRAGLAMPQQGEQVATDILKLADDIKLAAGNKFQSVLNKGVSLGMIEEADDFAHMPRFAKPVYNKARDVYESKMVNARGYGSRSKARARVPVEVMREMAEDSATRGKGGVDHILKQYDEYLDPAYDVSDPMQASLIRQGEIQRTPEEIAKAKLSHAEDLRSAAKRPVDYTGPAQSFAQYMKRMAILDASAESIHKLFGDMSKVYTGGEVPVGYSVLSEAFQDVGMNPDQALEYFAKTTGRSAEELGNLLVDSRAVDAANSLMKSFDPTQEVWRKQVGDVLDTIVNTFKAAVTIPVAKIPGTKKGMVPAFPSFFLRNGMGGSFLNLTSGAFRTADDLTAYGKAVVDAGRHLRGDATAIESQYIEEMLDYGVLGSGKAFMDAPVTGVDNLDVPYRTLDPTDINRQATQDLAEGPRTTLAAFLNDNAPGGRFLGEQTQRAVERGSRLNERVEFVNRVPLFAAMRRQGYSAEVAAEMVESLHFDYGDVTKFERAFAKRAIPFWSFQKKVAPLIAGTLLQKPGGALAQVLRATETMREGEGFVPDYIGETLAVPLEGVPLIGKEDRFLTGFGLPHEEVFNKIASGATIDAALQRTFEKAVASSSPFVKLPYTLASQRDPFTGRPLSEVPDFPTDNDQINALLQSLPTARAQSMARTFFFDDRKDLLDKVGRWAVPARITDPYGGLERARDYAVGDVIEQLAEASPNLGSFERLYAFDDAVLTPEEQLMMQLYAGMQRRKQQAARDD